MCSLNWRKLDNKIILAFNRDESVERVEALPPQRFSKNGVEYVMPVDPQGQGSWIAMNNKGLVFFLLNDYQGRLKDNSDSLISRGKLIQTLATCPSIEKVNETVTQWPLEQSQPFVLGILSLDSRHSKMFHYDGITEVLSPQPLPNQLYSSGDPNVEAIIKHRTEYVDQKNINSMQDLMALHQQHEPYIDDGYIYSLCMHRPEAESQSMTLIEVTRSEMVMEYYAGAPCKATLENKVRKVITL